MEKGSTHGSENTLEINIKAAATFIRKVHGSEATPVTFFAMKDKGEKESRHYYGTLGEHLDTLVRLNGEGFGIFLLVNRGNQQGRKTADITGLTALFTDDDGGQASPNLLLPPSVAVQSQRGRHLYWLLKPAEPLERFTPAQAALAAHFGTDPAVKDLTRVMRLPGFFHRKDPNAPFMVELLEAHESRYSIDDILAAYPAPAPSPDAPANDNGEASGVDSNEWKHWRRRALAALELGEVYRGLLTGKTASGGWLECRDPSSPTGDQAPSAGVADGTGTAERGSFHSFRIGETLSAFDFLVRQGVARDFADACHWVADVTGVALPSDQHQEDLQGAPWKLFKNDSLVVQTCIPILREKVALLRSPNGTERVFFVNERREATFLVKPAPMKQVIHDGLKKLVGDIPPSWLLDRSIDLWGMESDVLSVEPEPFCFRGDDRLCFQRFDWEPCPGVHPAWDEFLARLSDAEAFKAYVWSCFEKKNGSRQYIWLRGDGQDGKSTVLSVLCGVFGGAATAINNTHLKNDTQFLFSAFYGKRIVVYPDCKNAKVGMSEFLRNCTSGDPVLVEFKGQTPFTCPMRVKFFIGSNLAPQFTGQAADTSRIIYIEVSRTKNSDDPNWHDRLKSELPFFLWTCAQSYKMSCPVGGDIHVSDSTKELCGSAVVSFEEQYHEIFERNFRVVPGVRAKADLVSGRLRNEGLSNNEIADYKRWLERRGVRYKVTNAGRCYENLEVVVDGQGAGRRVF